MTEKTDAIMAELRKHPADIEDVLEYANTVPSQVEKPMKRLLRPAQADRGVLVHGPRGGLPTGSFSGCPIHRKRDQALGLMKEKKVEYAEVMQGEQTVFEGTLTTFEGEIRSLQNYTDVTRWESVERHISLVEEKLTKADEDARTFNQREGLFDQDVTEYQKMPQLKRAFEPYKTLWATTAQWKRTYKQWMDDPFDLRDPEVVEKETRDLPAELDQGRQAVHEARAGRVLRDRRGHPGRGQGVHAEGADRDGPPQPGHAPLGQPQGSASRWCATRSSRCRRRSRWASSSTLVEKIGDTAGKEFQLEVALNMMEAEWKEIDMEILPYKNTGTFVLKARAHGGARRAHHDDAGDDVLGLQGAVRGAHRGNSATNPPYPRNPPSVETETSVGAKSMWSSVTCGCRLRARISVESTRLSFGCTRRWLPSSHAPSIIATNPGGNTAVWSSLLKLTNFMWGTEDNSV